MIPLCPFCKKDIGLTEEQAEQGRICPNCHKVIARGYPQEESKK